MPMERFDLGNEIDSRDLKELKTLLRSMGPRDELTIRLEAADAHQADMLTAELERQGFDYQPHGGDGKDFTFTVRRRLH